MGACFRSYLIVILMKNNKGIPIIDLFAGPGGLAEGFSSLVDPSGDRIFNIKLSIEKEKYPHQTLMLRSFLRQFPFKKFPKEYYLFLEQKMSLDNLYCAYPNEFKIAKAEAWQATLGEVSNDELDSRISAALENNDSWVLIGGPPCQAYSMAGRSRVGGIDEKDHRVHLYKEYLRIIARHQPSVFVMENVKGLLSAKVAGVRIFDNILADLKDPSSIFSEYPSSTYKIYSLVNGLIKDDNDFLIKAEEYGVPQKRHRVILIGVRDDLQFTPDSLSKKLPVTLQSVIGSLPRVRSGIYRELVSSELKIIGQIIKRKRTYKTLKDSFELWSSTVSNYFSQLKALGGEFNPEFSPKDIGCEYFKDTDSNIDAKHPLYTWYTDKKLVGVLHHVSRSHLKQDLKRYLFSSLYTRNFGKFPRLEMFKEFGEDLVPDHENVDSGKFNDRFRVQLPYEPATTITSHISKDGHYFIHYDSSQCRSLTVREAARIQTFPDNYYFCGSRTEQYHQVGNAVPPYLAFQISKIVSDFMMLQKMSTCFKKEIGYVE